MPKTTITDPDGRVTTIRKSGCGCGAILTVLLLVYVIAAPAESFPLWGKVLAYMFEGAIVVGVLWAWGSGRIAWSNGRFETGSRSVASSPRLAEGGLPRQTSAIPARQISAPPAPGATVVDEIKKLAELRDSGILTDAEFQAKKTELLSRL